MAAKLFKAIRDADLDSLEELISKGTNVNEIDKKGIPAIIECVSQGFEEGIEALINAGANTSAQDKKDGKTALIAAVIDGQAECLSVLLDKDQSISKVINMVDSSGMTALHWALKLQEIEMANQLISQSSIKFTTVAKDGYSPLMYAVQIGDEEIVQTLLKNSGAKSAINATDKSGNNVAHIAALLDFSTILEHLFSLSSPSSLINSKNENGESPLHLAASSDNLASVKVLMAHGADLQALTKDGLTPFQVSDSSSPSAKLIAEKTGEVASIIEESDIEEEEEIEEDIEEEIEKEMEKAKEIRKEEKIVRKRKVPPQVTTTTKRGKNEESSANSPLIAKLLLVLIVGSSLTYMLSI